MVLDSSPSSLSYLSLRRSWAPLSFRAVATEGSVGFSFCIGLFLPPVTSSEWIEDSWASFWVPESRSIPASGFELGGALLT